MNRLFILSTGGMEMKSKVASDAVVPAVTVVLIVFVIVVKLCQRFIPALSHPGPWSLTISGVIMVGLSFLFRNMLRSLLTSMGTIAAWLGWVSSLLDHVCPAGFFGFLGVALLVTIPCIRTIWPSTSKLWQGGLVGGVIGCWIFAILLSNLAPA